MSDVIIMALVHCQIKVESILQPGQKGAIILSIICHYQVTKWKSAIYINVIKVPTKAPFIWNICAMLALHNVCQKYTFLVPQTCQLKHQLHAIFMPIEYNLTSVQNTCHLYVINVCQRKCQTYNISVSW